MNTRFIFTILSLGILPGASTRLDEPQPQPIPAALPGRDFGGEIGRAVRSTFELMTFSAPPSNRRSKN